MPKQKTICNYETWSKPQYFHFCFVFVFDVVCYLQIMDFGLHFSQFGQHLAMINLFFVQLLGHISFGGSADG